MQKNPIGPRVHFAALAVAISAFFGFAAHALADDAQATLYHVQENTFGCGDPGATRLLTDPNESRRSSPSWMKTTISNGRCVTITPRSPWKLVSQGGGIALMEYAGTVGAPGSYYILESDLVDPVGQHPGDTASAPAPAASAQPPAAPANSSTAAAPNAAETALAPAPQDVPNPAAPVALHGSWTTWDVLLLLLAISIAGVVGYIVGRNTRPELAPIKPDYLSK
jgi:hypothetical protein